MYERYIIVSKDIGVYLGSCLGMHFWSNLDSVGQDAAISFETAQQAQDFLKTYPGQFEATDTIEIKKVYSSDTAYASIAECVAVGVPDWTGTLSCH